VSPAIPRLVTGTVALILVVAVFMPPLEPLRERFTLFFDILVGFGLVLGAASLLRSHVRRIRQRVQGWHYSVVCLTAFVLYLVVGMGKLGSPAGLGGPVMAEGSPFTWVYDYVFSPCAATMMSLLAFFLASAAFRAFRMRTAEATVMLVTAFLILLGRTFLGDLLTSWLPPALDGLRIPNLVAWITSVPLTAGNRAIMIGIALGAIATSLKVMLGLEHPYLRGGK
jgi:hypothetical protein